MRRLPYGAKVGLKALLRRSSLKHEAFDTHDDDFAEIQSRFFANRPRCPAYSKCISSRHFEAAATGTCQLLVEGRYNDILIADEHYIPLLADLRMLRKFLRAFVILPSVGALSRPRTS